MRAIPFQSHIIISSLIVIPMCCSSSIDKVLEAYQQLARQPNAPRIFLLNQDNWDSYMECMCRVGRLNDAVKMVCLDMGNVQKDMIPNKVTVRLLLMFTARLNQQDETLLHPTIPSGPVGELATSPWGVCHKANTHRDTI